MNREEIAEECKWDVSLIYKTKEEFKEELKEVKMEILNIKKYKECFLENENIFVEFMKRIEMVERKIEKLHQYSHLCIDVEPDNLEIQEQVAQVNAVLALFNNETVFVTPEIIKNEVKIKEIIKQDKAKIYEVYVKNILRNKPHILSDKEEEILAKVEDTLESSYQTYSSLRPEFKPVIVDNKEHFLNEETMKEFLKSKDEKVRKQAYENIYCEYKKFSNVFANTLVGNLKKDVFLSNVRKFSTPLEASIFEDDVPKELFEKVLEMANEKYHSYLLEYVDVMKQVLKKEELQIYDINIPLVEPINDKYSIDQAFDLIFEATKNLKEDYRSILEKARKERWIDYMPHTGKRHGAYSSGVYDTNPYILMSFTNDLESIFTLIHELGHSVHSYYSAKNQEYINYSYRIFVAEVASTVNENLLMNTLIQKAQTKQEKAYLLYRRLQDIVALIYRQPFFANFENKLHEKIANDEGLSNQTITDLYEELTNEYWGGKVKINEYTKYSCYYVPHFYYNYYVYKYTVGHCVSCVIANRIFKKDEEQIGKYLKFLQAGCSKSPIELLQLAGVDPLSDTIYKEAFEDFKSTLEEFKKVVF